MKHSIHSHGRFLSIGFKLAAATVSVVAILALCVFVALTRYERRNRSRRRRPPRRGW